MDRSPVHGAQFARYLREDRRLLILRLLSRQGDYCLNDGLLMQGLDHLGHGIGRAELIGDLTFLQRAALIDCRALSERLQRVFLLELGLEVARGKSRHRGVRPPTPTEISQDHDAALERAHDTQD